jgi:hypothetical protein
MKALCTVALLSICAISTVFAEKVPNDGPGTLGTEFDCPTDGYKHYFGSGGSIPDADPTGVVFGPIITDGSGATLADVILDVDMSHTWIGDLRLSLLYDANCDGVAEVEASVLCRPQLAGCPPDGCCGCSGDLSGLYLFSDVAPSIEDICPGLFAPDCYGPDLDSSGLGVLVGMPKPGCFWLFGQDGAGGDLGTVFEWSVHTAQGDQTELCCYPDGTCYEVPLGTCEASGGSVVGDCADCFPTPTETTSWGDIKARY